MRCLWISGDVPYPTTSGRRVYSAGLSDALARAGVDVVGLGIELDGRSQAASPVEWRRIPCTQGPTRWRRLTSRWPSMADDRQSPPFRAAVQGALNNETWDVAVVDHLQMCWSAPMLLRAGVPVAYVAHNHESSARREIADHLAWSNPKKAPLVLDARRCRRCEHELVAESFVVSAITEADAARFVAGGARRVVVLSPGYSGEVRSARTIDGSTPRRAVIVTNLDWHVKRSNLMRLLEYADPLMAEKRIELRIVGPAPMDFVDRVSRGLRATRFLGSVDSVDEELDSARVGVICERDGGGFKLKALDYVFRRVPMAVLDGSMEGLPLIAGTAYASSPTEAALAQQIVELVDDVATCERMQSEAFDRCSSQFDWSTRGAALAAALDRISSVKA